MGSKYLTVGQVSKLLDCSPYHVVTLIEQGALESHRLQDRGWHRVTRESVRKLTEKMEIEADWGVLDKSAKLS